MIFTLYKCKYRKVFCYSLKNVLFSRKRQVKSDNRIYLQRLAEYSIIQLILLLYELKQKFCLHKVFQVIIHEGTIIYSLIMS